MQAWQVRVTIYGEDGSYEAYSDQLLQEKHQELEDFALKDLILYNEPEIRYLSPITGGFRDGFYYTFDVCYPAGTNKFCCGLINKAGKLKGLKEAVRNTLLRF